MQAEPLEGGSFIASGRMWVAPEAETDPRAVAMQGSGQRLPLDALLRRYLPPASSPTQSLISLSDSSSKGANQHSSRPSVHPTPSTHPSIPPTTNELQASK